MTSVPIQLPKLPLQRGAFRRYFAAWQAMNPLRRLFTIGLILPTLIAILYYGLYASPRYVSEAEFVVRGVSSRRMSGLEMLFQTFGISRTVDDSNAVQSFMLSRDAARSLESELQLRRMYGKSGIDVFSRFPKFWRDDSFERLYDYYLDRVSVVQDPTKGIATLRVIAFDPQDAQAIATALLRLAEGVVNRMNERAQGDAVKSATVDLKLAESRVIQSQQKLTEFRMRAALLDPGRDSTSVLETITTLSTEMARTLAQVAELQSTSPSNPSIASLQARADSLQLRIVQERRKISGGDDALATKLADFERLTLDRQLAEKGLAGADASLEAARQEARRQQVYLEQIVSPNLPDSDTEPQRLRMIATVFVTSFAMAAVGWILVAGSKEHAIE